MRRADPAHRGLPALLLGLALAGVAASAVIAQETLPTGIARLAPSPPDGPQPEAALVEQGEPLFQQLCAACHGAEARGGPGGSPDLTRSAIAMAADGGAELHRFLLVGRPEKGMPPVPVSEAQSAALSARLRALGFAAAAERAPDAAGAGTSGAAPALAGDAAAGRAFFNGEVGRCSSCHAVRDGEAGEAANLAHVASKYPDWKSLQNNMVLNRTFFWSPSLSRDVTAAVTFRDGRTVTGFLSSVSDFKVVLRDSDERETIIPRSDGEPRVVLHDRLQHHLDLLERYRDSDIHDLTAYLATLK